MNALQRLWSTTFGCPPTRKTQVVLDADTIAAREAEGFPDSSKGLVSWKTLISAPQTSTDALTVGIATCPPKSGHLCRHRHSHAELYHIISGHGLVSIDGIEQTVRAGSVIYIPGDAEHSIRNEDPDNELRWLYCFGADGFADIKYRF